MTPSPEIKPLSLTHRKLTFLLFFVLFCIGVPSLVFYAIGYRIDLSGETRNIRAVGGMYISADAEEISIYVDDSPVEDMRIFFNAAYIQNLDAGVHQVHVQGEHIATWIKELPVFAHLVTEAESFNMPTTPQVRLITQYATGDGASVVSPMATSTFSFASTTNVFYATTSKATSTFKTNPEYTYLKTLFASTTEARMRMQERQDRLATRFLFPGMSTSSTSTIEIATSTKRTGEVVLYQSGEDVFAQWVGRVNDKPHFLCVTYTGASTTAELYGEHVVAALEKEFASTTDFTDPTLIGTSFCRSTVQIDRKMQSVQYFDFLPSNDHLVLMHLQDGVYVVEIDDRAWQNVQLLYPGDSLSVLVDGDNIFIKDGTYILEVFTELKK